MEISTILTADILDILFEGRNKEYGAYELRSSYRKRLLLSIAVMLSVVLLLFIGFAFAGKNSLQGAEIIIPSDPTLVDLKPIEKEPPPPLPAKPAAPPVQLKTIKATTPVIVQNDKVSDDDKPPINEDLTDAKIGIVNHPDGITDDGTLTPPGDVASKGIIEIPRKDDAEDDWTRIKVEIESEYPGGMAAWQRYLNRNLRYPQLAIDNEIKGTVMVQFIVDKEGLVSNVEAVSGPEELRAEAVRVIKKSGKWTPAVQNGHHVKSYKKQPITFVFGDQ